jgi:hypothetical protein
MIGGGPIRSASLVEYLSRHFSVHAVVFRQKGDPDPALAIPPGRVEKLDVLHMPFHSKHAIAWAVRNSLRAIRSRPPLFDRFLGFKDAIAKLVSGRKYEAAIIEHFWCAPYVEQLRPCSKRVILDLHNIESSWHQRLAALEGPARAFALRRFATGSVALERKWLPDFDSLLVTSAQDAELVRSIAPAVNVAVYPNALPEMTAPHRGRKSSLAEISDMHRISWQSGSFMTVSGRRCGRAGQP